MDKDCQESEDTCTLKVPMNFDLSKVDMPEIPDDIIFPDELNKLLREQIRYHVHENGMLQKNLSEAESRYQKSKNKITELESKLRRYENDGTNLVNSTHVASSKIVELSKKLREKNSEVEVLKTKNSKLQQVIYELQEKPEDNVLVEEQKPVNDLEETIKKLEEKLNYTTNKLGELRSSNFQLKNDLKAANRWLQQEIGESFESLQTMTTTRNGWRGRAQIILDLQQKNCELRDKVKNVQDKVSKSTLDSVISKAESKITLLSKENNDLRTQYEDIKKKNDAARARCKVIENDCVLLKSKFTMIKEQSQRDQEIIATLSAQITTTKEMKSDVIKEKDNAIIKLQKEKETLLTQVQEYKSSVKKIRNELESKNSETEDLRNNQSCHKCRTQYEVEKKLQFLEAERQSLLQLTAQHYNRLAAERDAHENTKAMLRQEKQKATRAEAKAAKAEVDSSSRSSYSSSGSRATNISMKDQLELAEENVKALQTRLELEGFERKADLQEFVKILEDFDSKLEGSEDAKNEVYT